MVKNHSFTRQNLGINLHTRFQYKQKSGEHKKAEFLLRCPKLPLREPKTSVNYKVYKQFNYKNSRAPLWFNGYMKMK